MHRFIGSLAAVCTALLVSTTASVAHAHIYMMEPTPRSTDDGIKVGPCGNDPRTTPTQLTVGDDLTIKWAETIDHPGYHEVSFDPTGTDSQAEFAANVWVDNFTDVEGGQLPHVYETVVKVPDQPCNPCTLQLVQFMSDQNDFYYACADIVILAAEEEPTPTPTAGPTPSPGPTQGPDGEAGDDIAVSGCTCSVQPRRTEGLASFALLGLVLVLLLVRHRREVQHETD